MHMKSAFCCTDQAMDRGLPSFMVLPGLRQLHDVVGGVLERDELASARQRDRIVEPAGQDTTQLLKTWK